MNSPFSMVSLRRDEYRDSGSLMRLTKALEGEPGVQRAAAIMATPRNLEMLFRLGFSTPEALGDARPADLAIVIVAADQAAAELAMGRVARLLAGGGGGQQGASVNAPRSLEAALALAPETSLALVSVPGPFAAREARKALDHGLSVFLFSNGVSLEQELRLKQLAVERGQIVMGPDCGTAILDGVPLGFANRLPRGPVGIIGASGTGIQEVSCLLAAHGVGISQAFGIGGRDLSESVGGLSARAALGRLQADGATRLLFLISKPPAPAVASELLATARATGRAVVACFLGDEDGDHDGTPVFGTLEGAVFAALRMLGEDAPRPNEAPLVSETGRIVGLYTGGSLAYEATVIFKRAGLTLRSNLAAGAAPDVHTEGHVVLDLGEDEYTRGRPHPMIDPSVRAQFVLELCEAEQLSVLLLDFVLGTASHEDPVGALAPALKTLMQARSKANKPFCVVASVTGTEADAQSRSRQEAALRELGVTVCSSNAQAARVALGAKPSADERRAVVTPQADASPDEPGNELALGRPIAAVNLGLEIFADELAALSVPLVRVDYRPPAGGDERLARLLEALS